MSDGDPEQLVRADANKVFAESTRAERVVAMQATSEWGLFAVRTVFLLNGAAIVALLAFLGSLYGKDGASIAVAKILTVQMANAFQWFLGGVGAAAFTTGMGYLNWSAFTAFYPDPSDQVGWIRGKEVPAISRIYHWIHRSTMILSIVSAFASLGAFCIGAMAVVRAFHSLAI